MNLHINNSQKIFRIFMIVFMLVGVMFAVTPVRPAYASTFTVDSAGDGGDVDPGDGVCDADPDVVGVFCTLRAAIEEANFAADLDTINFTASMTITPASDLPTISENVTIDGTVAFGTVEIDFSGVAGDGFVITASNVTIRMLDIYDGPGDGIYVNGGSNVTIQNMDIHNFSGNGVLIEGGATNVLVDSNYIGVMPDGSTGDGNGIRGVLVNASPSNSITDNVISDNNSNGIAIIGAASDGNTIKGNYIGTNYLGTAALGNGGAGIYIFDAPNTQIGGATGADRNYVSGNTNSGVYVWGASDGTAIQGNYIGTDKIGESTIANTIYGVWLNGTTGVTVGGGSSVAGNLISGNGNHGVYVSNAPAANTIQNNTIGLDVDGDTDLGNSGSGIRLNSSDNTYIASNTISKNTGSGILIDSGSTGSDLQSNRIGISRTGPLSLGNGNDGVEIIDSPDNVINNNTIANNTADGISVSGAASVANTITSNSIYSNGGLGIDLGDNNVTANDGAGDPDSGPNTYQNFPVITSAAIEGSGVRVIGYLESGPYASRGNYSLQFFHQTTCDGSGSGEGKTLMKTSAISLPGIIPTPDRYDFDILIDPFSASVGDFITTTATYDAGAGGLEDTSEFSPCATIPPSTTVFVVNSTGDGADASLDGSCDVGGGVCTLRAAIEEVNFGGSPPYTIAFNIGGPFTITLGSSLDPITNQVIIDGTSQPGYISTPIIMVDGNGAATGFDFDASSSELRGLSIVGFTGSAVNINPGITGTTIEDNYIGLRTNGSTADGNQIGVNVNGASSNLILDNVISSNTVYGINLVGSAATANVIQGNYIGTDAGGTLDRGNTSDGIRIGGGLSNIIGGAGAGQRNIISGNNGDGIEMSGGGAGGNLVYGNYIGVQVNGTSALGNSLYGIKIDSMSNNLISNGNVIANNGSGGVLVDFFTSGGNLISQNSIYSNTGLGITLAGSANNSQPAPSLTTATTSLGIGYTLVDGFLTGFAPNSPFTLEFFSSPSLGTAGKTFEYSTSIVTDGAGDATFSVSLPVELSFLTPDVVTATATDGSNNTSQFSNAPFVVLGALPTLTPTSTPTFTPTLTPTPTNTVAPTSTNVPAPTNTLAPGVATYTSAPTNTPSPTGPTPTYTPLGGAPAITLTAMSAEETLLASGATVTGTPPTETPWWAATGETPSPGGPTNTPEGDGAGGGGADTDTPTSTVTETPGISDADATATAQAAGGGGGEEEEEGGGMSSFLWILIIIALLILLAGGAMELIRWLNSREE